MWRPDVVDDLGKGFTVCTVICLICGFNIGIEEGEILDVEQGIVCGVVITGTVNDGVNLAGDHLLSYLAIGAERARTVNVELYGAAGLLVQLRATLSR